MSPLKTFLFAVCNVGFCLVIVRAGYESHSSALLSIIGPATTHSAGHLGNLAGLLTAGKALSDMQLSKPVEEVDSNGEEHDFSETAAKDSPSLYESLGKLGDNLQEDYFPADYGQGSDDQSSAVEYTGTEDKQEDGPKFSGETDYQPSATSEFPQFEEAAQQQSSSEGGLDYGQHLNEIDTGYGVGDGGDFYGKPVKGINHGKGAFSYSTSYEFKKPQKFYDF